MRVIKILLPIIFFCLPTILSAQINFEQGYYIDNTSNRVEGFIENVEWLDNPSEIKFKSTENSQSVTITKSEIKEFGITNGAVYTRYKVAIDKSSDATNNLSETRAPIFEEEELLLKKIIEGKASLYFYSGFGVVRFFYTHDNSPIQQLIYKRFQMINSDIGTNERYKQQLKTDLNCTNFTVKTFEKLKYRKEELSTLFKNYNTCSNSTSTEYKQVSKISEGEQKIRLRVKAGIRNNMFSYETSSGLNIDFPDKVGIQLGLEGEFIFKFNRNKWSALLDATYFDYSDENRLDLGAFDQDVAIDYSGIELGIGIRHSFFLNDDSRLFLNVSYVTPLHFDESLTRSLSTDLDEFSNVASAVFGGGFEFKDFSIELRYISKRSLLKTLNSNYSAFSATIGYSFL